MKKIADKRAAQLKEYSKMKKDKKEYMVGKGYYRCVFCNSKLDPEEDEDTGWHHLTGRDGELLNEWSNIVPAHNLCHSDFHHKSMGYLLNSKWYPHFVQRIKEGAKGNMFFAKAYNAELRRQQKAGVIDDEMFLTLYISDENN